MTCCIGSREGFIVADTLSVTGGMWKGPFNICKIIDFGHSILTCAGDATTRQKLHVALAKYKTAAKFKAGIQRWAQENKPENQLMVVNTDGELYVVNCDHLAEVNADTEFYAIGSGSDLAQGYMGAIEAVKGRVSPEDAVAAIVYSSKFNITVNDVVEVAFLQEPAKKTVKRKTSKKKKTVKRKK